MKFRYLLIVFLLNFIFVKKSFAAACADNLSPIANCDGQLNITQNTDEIINNFIISDTYGQSGIYNGAPGYTVGLIKNSSSSSSISGNTGSDGGGIYNLGTITEIVNFGLIIDVQGDPSIYNRGGTIGIITNESSAIIGTGIFNNGTITTISNIGTIRDDLNIDYVPGHGGNGIANIGGTITSVTNTGIISGGGQGGIYNTGTIGTNLTNGINNSGTIQDLYGGAGIQNANGTITSIINTSSGTINGGSGSYGYGGWSQPPVGIYNSGTITQIINSNLITGNIGGIYNDGGTIGTITNNLGATIRATDSYAITNYGTITSVTNNGNINSLGDGIHSNSIIENILNTNTGVISSDSSYSIYNEYSGIITTITNNGNITGYKAGIYNYYGSIGTSASGTGIINSGTILGSRTCGVCNIGSISYITNNIGGSITGNGVVFDDGTSVSENGGIYNVALGDVENPRIIQTISNAGTIVGLGGGPGIYNGDPHDVGATINLITNSGSITGSGQGGIFNDVFGTITTITNTGTISDSTAGVKGIINSGTITTLNNKQSSLTYSGNLPQNYNIILGSNASTFGTLVVTSPSNYDGVSGKTTFGINSGDVKSNKYAGVISGVSTTYLTAQTGTYDGYDWSLSLQSGSSSVWDLLFASYVSGPSSADTDTSLLAVATNLKGVINYQNSSLNHSLNYDCSYFGKNNFCMSESVRSANTNDNDSQSVAIIVATKISDQVRVGGYIDGTVNKDHNSNMKLNSNTPMFGAFIRFNQHDQNFGLRGGVSAGYIDQDLKSTRVVSGTSEPGTGTSNLNTKGIQAELQYGIDAGSFLTISPYLGYRNTQTARDKYTEETSSSVTSPLTYNKIKQNEETAFAGIELKSHFHTTDIFATLNFGYEHAAKFSIDNLSTTGVSGTSDINLESNIDKTRPVIMASLNQNLGSSGRLSLNFDRRQQVYSPTSSTNVALQYMVGF